jgi:phosphoglycolate phosphatase-like HAD superfamily hydrolase
MNLNSLQAILWDFDGVLMNSNPVRDKGFERVLADYPAEQVEALMSYHRRNGGLSRYVKFRYFFEEVRKEAVTDEQILSLAERFTVIMKQELVNPSLLIEDSLAFVRRFSKDIPMHIVSGSDQAELRYLCSQMNIASFFKSIHGSPIAKTELVDGLIKQFGYDRNRVVLIGDAGNDADAASKNSIAFCGYNNESLRARSLKYIESFAEVDRS